ncbi:MAG: toxic anion resistance protein, partial [Erythrobacter sp.]
QTVNVLTSEVERSKGYIARAEGQAQAQAKVASQTPSLLALDK